MPNCTAPQAPLPKPGRRAIDVRFDGGAVSSDGGLLLRHQIEQRLGLLKAVATVLLDPRAPALVEHTTEPLLRQRVFGLCQGFEALNDHDRLRDDLALQTAVGKDRPAASSPTLCRFENRADRKTAVAIQRQLVEPFIASFKKALEELVLDFDATDDLVRGQQERRHFSGYYDADCFLPLYVFSGEQLLVAYLRPEKRDAVLHAAAILKLLVTRLRQAWPAVRIIFRGDSGFCRPLLLSWCERNYVHYVVGMAKNRRLLAESEWWREQAARGFAWTQQPQRCFGEFPYRANSWPCHRRLIAKAEHTAQGPKPRFVVTSLRDEPRRSTQRCTAPAARWRIGSRNVSSGCSPIAPVAAGAGPISSACCSRHSPTSCSSACAPLASPAPLSPALKSGSCAAACSRSARSSSATPLTPPRRKSN